MPVQAACPHCRAPCVVAEEHFGRPVQCYRCKKLFTLAPPLPEVPPVAILVGPAPAEPPRLDVGAATSAGLVRPRNEDSFLIMHRAWSNLSQRHEAAVLVVADGMGGHEAGDQASGLAIRTLGQALTPLLTTALGGQFQEQGPTVLAQVLDGAVRAANRALFQRSQAEPGCKGMGSTLAAALIWDDQVVIGHVGDCRVYHFQAGRLTQITRDQTLVSRMIELGTLSAAEARRHPARHEVSKALGRRADIEVATHQLVLQKGDWLLLACDGLQADLEDAALRQEIAQLATASATQLAHQLVALADNRGGSDNCTVIAAHFV